jgi:hypothetical protein
MIQKFFGNIIAIQINANELTNNVTILVPDAYSFEKILILRATNIYSFEPYVTVIIGSEITFPPVNSKSPCTFNLLITDLTKDTDFRAVICKFGQIPDTHYFDKAFDPILVTGDDGNEYNVIPSDQFK